MYVCVLHWGPWICLGPKGPCVCKHPPGARNKGPILYFRNTRNTRRKYKKVYKFTLIRHIAIIIVDCAEQIYMYNICIFVCT